MAGLRYMGQRGSQKGKEKSNKHQPIFSPGLGAGCPGEGKMRREEGGAYSEGWECPALGSQSYLEDGGVLAVEDHPNLRKEGQDGADWEGTPSVESGWRVRTGEA